jgi:hypothetical protein
MRASIDACETLTQIQRSFTGFIRDITERKPSEARIQNLAHYVVIGDW